jgi:hypothetical protein
MVVAAVLGTAFLWPSRDNEPECFDRLQVGMSCDDVLGLVEQSGFRCAGGGGNARESVMVFDRKDGRRAIVLVFQRRGKLLSLVSKEWGGRRPKKTTWEWLLEGLTGRDRQPR